MPIPVSSGYSKKAFDNALELIYASRLIHKEDCVASHEDRLCHLDLNNEHILNDKISFIIDVVGKKQHHLFERWMMTFNNPMQIESMSGLHTYIKELPVHHLQQSMEMYHIIYFISNNSQIHTCYTHNEPERIDFHADSQLKSRLFYSHHLSIEVIHDASLLKPTLFSNWGLKFENAHHPHDVHPLTPTLSSEHTPTPVYAVRRLSRLSLSAMEHESEEEDTYADNITISIPSSRMQYTHHGSHHQHISTMAYSTSPNNMLSRIPHPYTHRRNSITADIHHGCLVGSYEESLFSGRMSSMPSKPITFHCQIGVLGHGDHKPKCPPHWSIVFPAFFYDLKSDDGLPIPYVGTVDIQDYVEHEMKKKQPGYRLPAQGQLQIVIKNPNKTAVKLFLIPYDVTDMPNNTKTFLRQKSYTYQTPHVLKYAIHILLCKTDKGRLYLHKSIRIVFANRIADARERFKVVCEGPKEPVYVPL